MNTLKHTLSASDVIAILAVGAQTHLLGQLLSRDAAVLLPAGSRLSYEVNAGFCYTTRYYATCTYIVTPRRGRPGCYLKREGAPGNRRGGKYNPAADGLVLGLIIGNTAMAIDV